MKKIIFLCIFLLISMICNSQIITTYAGDGISDYGGDGGLAKNAHLGCPLGINIDKNGNLLICMTNIVRKVNKITYIISSIAGDTAALAIGNGGIATNALVLGPAAVCVDDTGNLYIGDSWTSEVRKVNIYSGIIYAFAGSGIQGYGGDGGLAKNAKLNATVMGVCIDTIRKYLYIADEYNYRVRKVDMTTNIITTIAGTGIRGYSGDNVLAVNSELSRVEGIAID